MTKVVVAMENNIMNVTGGYQASSHKGTRNNDFGSNCGGFKVNIDVEVISTYDVGTDASDTNSVVFRSLETNLDIPNGNTGSKHLFLRFAHMNYADYQKLGIKVGKVFKAGSVIYKPGSAGKVSGPHIHSEFGIAAKNGYTGLVKAPGTNNYWMKDPMLSLHPYKAFYLVNGTSVTKQGDYRDQYDWKFADFNQAPSWQSMTDAEIANEILYGNNIWGNGEARKEALGDRYAGVMAIINGGSAASSGKIKKNDKLKINSSATKYVTGQNIPAWVKQKTYTASDDEKDGKVLLKEITSWVYSKDVTKV